MRNVPGALENLSDASASLVEALVKLKSSAPFEDNVEAKLLEMIVQLDGIRRMLE